MTMIKKVHVLLLLAGVLIASAAVSSFYSTLRKPKIEVTPTLIDLGDVAKEGFNYTFTVKNIGDKPLKIERVSTSCGCTLATIKSELIMPNVGTDLLVTFNPKLMEEEVKGKISRIIFIKSNDPENPDVEIKITANVVSG
jgi:hypothetical protein